MTPTTDPAVSYEQLIEAARLAQRHSYSPSSRYPVGAAILTTDGQVYTGCNIENSNFDLSVCAERSAAIKALCDGQRRFVIMAVVTNVPGGWPCGNCRQFLADFGLETLVVVPDSAGKIQKMTLAELLPRSAAPPGSAGVPPASAV